jgi:hypothetical protein
MTTFARTRQIDEDEAGPPGSGAAASENENVGLTRSGFGSLLTSGGDERIWLDPVARRSRYGTPALPAPNEIWLSSSTASAIAANGYVAAREAFLGLVDGRARKRNLGDWFDDLRARIIARLGFRDCEAILAASGTETELIALVLAKALLSRPIANVVLAPAETGSGVMHAAAGNHFADTSVFASDIVKGGRLAGWETDAISTIGIDIREADGRLREAAAVDAEAAAVVERALRSGSDVLLHVLDASKTGQQGPTRDCARQLSESFGDRILVVVDACQLRCSFDDLRADLEAGFLVMVTGSKFAGGPPFCGALLVPPSRVRQLCGMRAPAGLAAYSARMDWPSRLRGALGGGVFAAANLGVGLRWEAALSEIGRYAAIRPRRRRQIAAVFAETVRDLIEADPDLALLDEATASRKEVPSIFPIVAGDGDVERTRLVYEALRTPLACSIRGEEREFLDRICHVGQPVVVAGRSALRICSSMPVTNLVAARLDRALDLDAAFRPIRKDVQLVFRKWAWLREQVRGSIGR